MSKSCIGVGAGPENGMASAKRFAAGGYKVGLISRDAAKLSAMATLGVGKGGIRNLTVSLAKELESNRINVATVTIAGLVKPGTDFDPAKIAETFWTRSQQTPGSFKREVVFK